MQIHNSEALALTYGVTATKTRDSIAVLSPLVTEALALLDQPGQNPLYGPIPALLTVATELTADKRDLAWRVDWIKTTDAQPIGATGRVSGFVPAGLDEAFAQTALTVEQIETAKNLINRGASFHDAAVAAQSGDPQTVLDALRIAELNNRIDNWSGSDNDQILDDLIRERRDLIERNGLEGYDPSDIDSNILIIAAQHGVSYEEALFSMTAATIDSLNTRIENWSGSDNDPILDQMIAERNAQIDVLVEGDPALALRMRTSMSNGKSAHEAAVELVEFVDQQARIDAVTAELNISRDEATERLASIDEQFETLVAQGLTGTELEIAATVLYNATMQGYDFDEIDQIVKTQGVSYETAAQLNAQAQTYGMTGEEFSAMQGFVEHFDTFDTAAPVYIPTGYNASYVSTPVSSGNGKVTIGNLEYVVNNPNLYSAAEVSAAQALLNNPQLLNRIDTAKDNNELFANGDSFGRTDADDQVYSLEDVQMFEAKQFTFAQLNPHQDDIDVAFQGGATDGHLSKSDYETFLANNLQDLSEYEIQALEIVIAGDLYDQTWWEENKNSIAMASALVAAGAFTIATGGAGGIVVAGLIGATAAGTTTVVINAASDNLDWHEDLAMNTIQGGLVGVGTASVGGSMTALRTGATPGARILGATELTAEATGTIALGTFDPMLRPIIGQDALDDTKAVTGTVATITGVGALGGNLARWATNRNVVEAIPTPGSTQQPLLDTNVGRPGQQALFDPAPYVNPAAIDLPPASSVELPGQLNLFDDIDKIHLPPPASIELPGQLNLMDEIAPINYSVDDTIAIARRHGASSDSVVHLIDGDINRSGRAVGGHYRDSPNIRIIHEWIDPQTGLDVAHIEVFDAGTSTWVPKLLHNGDPTPTTLFPREWTPDRVIAEVQNAFSNSSSRPNKPNQWFGTSNSGYEISGYYRNSSSPGPGWSTAFPTGAPLP